MKRTMFVLAALLFSAPAAEAQLFRGRDRGDRVSVRIRSRSPRPRPYYALPVYQPVFAYQPYAFAPAYDFAPRGSRFDLDLRLRSSRGGCVGGYCP